MVNLYCWDNCDLEAAEKEDKGFLRAGRVFFAVTRAVSEGPYMLATQFRIGLKG